MTPPPKLHYSASESVQRGLFAGGAIQFIHTESVTFAAWTFDSGTQVSRHAHPHEQITHCIAGELILDISGQAVVLGPGETAVIPPNVEHSARADIAARGVDVFFPVREDYKF